MTFTDCTEQQIPRPIDKERRKTFYSGKKKRHTVKNHIMVNNRGYILHKVGYKKGRKHDYDVYKKNHPVIPKQVVNIFDLGYRGIEKDYQNNYHHCHSKRKETKSYLMRKKSTTKFIQKRE